MKNIDGSDKKTIRAASLPSTFEKWRVATRPFSFPASTMSVIFGTTLAVTIGKASFNFVLFIAAFIGMVLLHAGSNLLNDVFDYKKGIDCRVNPVSGAVVRGWITPATALRAGLLFMAGGTVLGLFIVSRVGMPVFWIGAIGVTIGILYTWGPLPLKFNGMGDLAVFLNFGILGSLGAWTVQTGFLSWTPVLWAVPMSLLVVGILHANNWRDIDSDSSGGIRTMAGILGDTSSETYYRFLLLSPFACILLLVLFSWADGLRPRMPLSFLITLLVIPIAFKLIKKGKHRFSPENPQDFIALDGDTAKLNLLFGILCTLALGLNALIFA
ncbi:MAG: 1,4-dihydroxy-2-naphthoate octaprenyltransferase [Desulfobacteraceae bacterium 4572_123]|nr:MAG: 1,4-dihydroxy-2-naphthoate octaprenyltransferase [Desulfobacteraceae bacterium 4572_123]